MQQQLISTLDPVTAGAIQTILKSLSEPGILLGMELIPFGNQITVQPGAALTDSGVLIVEDEVKAIPFQQTVQPSQFTIFYAFAPSNNAGGNPAQLSIQQGFILPELFQNGVILGWVNYPGNSVSLQADMLIRAREIRLKQPVDKEAGVLTRQFAPLGNRIVRSFTSGTFLTVSESFDSSIKAPVTTFTNAGNTLSNSKYVLPVQVGPSGLGKVVVEFSLTSAASARISVLLADGTTEVIPSGDSFFINASMGVYSVTIPKNIALQPNSIAYIQFEFSIQPANSVVIKSVATSAFTEPF